MAHYNVQRLACLVTFLAVTSQTIEDSRWSRQLSTYTADISDWVPLSSPVEKEAELTLPQNKRQAVAEPRILTEPFPSLPRVTSFNTDAYSSKNYFNNPPNRQQLYLQSVPSAAQNFLSDQGFGQNFRFGLTQPNFPLSQGFVAQPFSYENVPPPPPNPTRPQGIPLNPVNFPQSSGAPATVKGKPFLNQSQNTKSIPKYVDGYQAENGSSELALGHKKKPQSLQKIKFENGERLKPELTHQHAKTERGEEVQLLYVPLEQLNRGQFNFRSPLTSPQLVNTELFSQGLPRPSTGKQSFINEYQRPSAKPVDNFSGLNYFTDFNAQLKDVDQVPKYTTHSTPYATFGPTSPRTKKLKPHQPPLAIFTIKDVTKNRPVKVGDVLSSLKNAETIAVLDSVNPLNAPKVFIGPSNLPPPENFVKFDLPYLSNIDHSDNKLKQLPFFVAPLSYNTPNGFAKIPFPSPHVGSVVINAQIKDSAQTHLNQQSNQLNNNQNYYVSNPTYRPETKPTTQKTTFSYYTTAAPKTKPTPDSNYYSFEPQTVSSVRPLQQPETQTAPPKKPSYFLNNAAPQYNSEDFSNFPKDGFKPSEPIQQYNLARQPERATTVRTTSTTTTQRPSTYSSQLLETHNPYSINHAFHFSTPLDYHSYFDDVKQPQPTPNSVTPSSPSPASTPVPSKPKLRPEPVITEKPQYHEPSSPSYLNNYTPEIHYESEENVKYTGFRENDYVTKTQLASQPTKPDHTVDNKNTYAVKQYNNADSETYNYNSDYNKYSTNYNSPDHKYNTNDDSTVNQYNTDINTSVKTYKPEYNKESNTASAVENPSELNNLPTLTGSDTPTVYDEYENYEPTLDEKTSTSTTTTTTTRRTPIRSRGRPRYTTTPRSDSYESTRVSTTRRPHRRPSVTRPRYEPNKISTENPINKPYDTSESSTNAPRTRTRGRVQYKPSDNEELYENKKTNENKKEDLAYQRDVLHQNYPVTLTERAVDTEVITEPTYRQVSSIDAATETTDTENAYTNERLSVSNRGEVKDVSALPTFTARSTLPTENQYVPNLPSTRNEEYYFPSRSSLSPVQPSSYDDTLNEKDDDIYFKHTTPIPKVSHTETIAYATESGVTEQSLSNYNEYTTIKQEEITTTFETETTKAESQDVHPINDEENVVQTTSSYNRVRVRPGVTRLYHPATTTEASKPKERRRPTQPVTYRPAIDRRRTTMRIDEIEAGLKTKQIHARPDQEYRHPVYKPESSTEPSVPPSSVTETTTKRSQFRRRKPSYSHTTTTTEATSTKRTYEVKNRYRGRRTTTEKPTDKPETSTKATSSTRTILRNRYSQRPRLSERFNKKVDTETEVEDQDSNYSINRPRYVERSEQWSPKISSESFKPYNPNDVADEYKIATTERRSDKDTELDIITARNEYDDILLTVTPASNNRMNKKIPDIPPTLEALVEQSKVTKNQASDSMSTFESMLEEVMKSLEEKDQDEYSGNVMKHKGGEIGEIPPERIISAGDNYPTMSTTLSEEITTEKTTVDDYPVSDEDALSQKSRRRGFWKKVKVRPVTTESIEFAESQYYSNTVNQLGEPINIKKVHEKSEKQEKPKVTTYKPNLEFLTDLFSSGDDFVNEDVPKIDILKVNNNTESTVAESLFSDESKQTTVYVERDATIRPWDLDLGTGSPDPTIDELYFTTPTEPTSKATDKVDTFSFLDYLFGVTSEDSEKNRRSENNITKTAESTTQISTEQTISKATTTETAFIPEEITESTFSEERTELPELSDIKKINSAEESESTNHNDSTVTSNENVESSSISSFMDPLNILSTSLSTEISHETEICFRGKCIKTNRDIL